MSECESCGADREFLACRCGEALARPSRRRVSRRAPAGGDVVAVDVAARVVARRVERADDRHERRELLSRSWDMQRLRERVEALRVEDEIGPVVFGAPSSVAGAA